MVRLDPLTARRTARRLLAASLILAAACAVRPLGVEKLRGGDLATMRPVEDIVSLHDPPFVPAGELDRQPRAHTPMLAFVAGGGAYAIALRVLDDHEIVNGAAFAATW